MIRHVSVFSGFKEARFKLPIKISMGVRCTKVESPKISRKFLHVESHLPHEITITIYQLFAQKVSYFNN